MINKKDIIKILKENDWSRQVVTYGEYYEAVAKAIIDKINKDKEKKL